MNINLMWRYWAAKEIAEDIFSENPGGHYWEGSFYFSSQRYVNNLTQILKKEWFR